MTAPGTAPIPPKPKSELKTRLITGAILTVITLWSVWAGLYPFACLVLPFSVLGQHEFQTFAEQKGFRPGRRLSIVMTLVLLAAPLLGWNFPKLRCCRREQAWQRH